MPIRASGIWLMFKGCRWQKTNFITNKEGKSLAYAGGKESRVTQRIEGGEWAPGPPGPEQEVEVIRTHFLTTTPVVSWSLSLCLSPSFLLCLTSLADCHLTAKSMAAEVQIQISLTLTPSTKQNNNLCFSKLSNISTTGVLWLVQFWSCHGSGLHIDPSMMANGPTRTVLPFPNYRAQSGKQQPR